jgi:small basic protein
MSRSEPTPLLRQRTWLAMASAPLAVPALILFGQTFVSGFDPHRGPDWSHLQKFLGEFPILLLFSYGLTLGIGLPVLALLTRWRLRTMIALCSAGALAGLVLGLILAAVLVANQPTAEFPWFILAVGAALAALHGAVFSLVAGFPLLDESVRAAPDKGWVQGIVAAATVLFLLATLTAAALFGVSGG